MTKNFDLIIIGGGPAGYVAAIRAAQLGFSVACCDARPAFGGTCLNVGCIPAKVLLQSSAFYHNIQHHAKTHGILTDARVDFATMVQRKDAIVRKLCKGIDFLFKKNNVTGFNAVASFKDQRTLQLQHPDGQSSTLSADKAIIIASGSEPTPLPDIKTDETHILTSTGALGLQEIPRHLVIAGAGVIGLEIGSVYRRLGSEVTVVELLDTITPGMDKELTKAFHKSLQQLGISFLLEHKIDRANRKKDTLNIAVSSPKTGEKTTLSADKLLIAIGRRPLTSGLNLRAVGIQTEKGRIPVDDHFQTSCKGVYAVGDCIGGLMLAHKAEEEAIALVESLAGQSGHVDYRSIPSIIYTEPEVAFVGASEEMLKSNNEAYHVGKAAFAANGRAMAMEDTYGFVKILAGATTDTILGAHIIGPMAGDLLQEVTSVMAFGGSSEDLARTNHAHPTLSETVKEAANKIPHMSSST